MAKSLVQEFTKGLWKEVPPFRLVLGLCPTLAVTKSVENGVVGESVKATVGSAIPGVPFTMSFVMPVESTALNSFNIPEAIP